MNFPGVVAVHCVVPSGLVLHIRITSCTFRPWTEMSKKNNYELSEHKNQIVDTIGTLLHHILGEFYRSMPCLLSTVFVTYFLEIREEA